MGDALGQHVPGAKLRYDLPRSPTTSRARMSRDAVVRDFPSIDHQLRASVVAALASVGRDVQPTLPPDHGVPGMTPSMAFREGGMMTDACPSAEVATDDSVAAHSHCLARAYICKQREDAV